MSRFLIISLGINLLIFTFYGYWLGKVLKNNFEVKEVPLSPLKVAITKVIKSSKTVKEQTLKVKNKETPGIAEKRKPNRILKQHKSLLSSIVPEVHREFQIFKKVVVRAKAFYKGKRIKILGSRKLIYVPPLKPLKVSYPPAPVEVKITILPDGRVIKAVLIKKSGNPKIDNFVLRLVKNLKFEAINEPVIQEMYIEFVFKY